MDDAGPAPPPGRIARRMCEVTAPFGVGPARFDEIPIGRQAAAELISPHVTSVEAFAAVHRRTGVGMFVFRENELATGFLGTILLRPSGLAKIEDDTFQAVSPDMEDVCLPDEYPAALYGWGFVSRTKKAAAAVVRAMMALRDEPICDVPYFCRASTPLGAKIILGKMGYRPFAPSKTGILIKHAPDRRAAA